MAYVRMWRFRPLKGKTAEFETAYGPNGDWARLFHRAQGFLGTTLLKGEEYLTIDRWSSREAYDRFMRDFREEFARLDASCEALTAEEEPIGDYLED